MKTYWIVLERKEKTKEKRFFRFECKEENFRNALLRAESKVKDLKLQTGATYEVIGIEDLS